MIDLTGSAVCGGCHKIVSREDLLNEDELCGGCEYEQDAKLDNLTDEE